MSALARAVCLSVPFAIVACGNVEDPPGRALDRPAVVTKLDLPVPAASAGDVAPDQRKAVDDEPGHGAKIASIAMRTWIYVAPSDRSTKLGYLRAGAVVDRAENSAGTKSCEGGWYRIAPRGFVCVGKGASLDVNHEVVQAALRGPDRNATLPYHYVMSRSPPPHLYFRLPSDAEQKRTEGDMSGRALRVPDVPIDDLPAFLAQGHDLPKPYGAAEALHYSVHAGRAKEASAFGLITAFTWTNRTFGLTTELDLIALDRTKPAKISTLQGAIVDKDKPGIPAIVIHHDVPKLVLGDNGRMREDGKIPFRTGVVLTGKTNGGERGLWESVDGYWVPAESMKIADVRQDQQGYAKSGKKWIDVAVRKQMLVAYEGLRPVFATLVSTGRGGMSDPSKSTATIRGNFFVHAKHVSGTMDGEEGSDSFDLRDVPYIQYFHEGYALHGAYWHDEFGKDRSHGCVNLAPADAKWLFDWTDPVVPPEWHGAVNMEGGTLIWVHGG